jgi:hypothetical protein
MRQRTMWAKTSSVQRNCEREGKRKPLIFLSPTIGMTGRRRSGNLPGFTVYIEDDFTNTESMAVQLFSPPSAAGSVQNMDGMWRLPDLHHDPCILFRH